MEQGLQLDVGLQHAWSNENVGIAEDLLRLLANQAQQGDLRDGAGGLAVVHRAQ